MVGRTRRPYAAGVFYEAGPEALRAQLEWCFSHPLGPGASAGGEGIQAPRILLVPHGGYYYSCPVAAHGYALLRGWGPGTVVVAAPNHTGLGAPVSVASWERWETPLGGFSADFDVARFLARRGGGEMEPYGSMYEHSVEVQLPFLRYVAGPLKLAALVMLDQSIETAERLGEALAALLGERGDVVVVATTNLSAYEPRSTVAEKDKRVIDAILEGNVAKLYRLVKALPARLCGPGVAAAAMRAAKLLGLKPRLLSYATSSDVSGDPGLAVGYASIAWF